MVGINDDSVTNADRLSPLPDDVLVLVLVLEKVNPDVRWLARITTLSKSKRWRTLPLMLPHLELSDEPFLYYHATCCTSPRWYLHGLHRATSKLTSALRFFLATNPTAASHRNINTLTLHFTLTKDQRQLNEIARLIGAAVGRGEVRRVELLLDTVELTSSLRLTQYSDDDSTVIGGVYARRFLRLRPSSRPAARPSRRPSRGSSCATCASATTRTSRPWWSRAWR